ncbi:MAG: hypothetical protein OXG69_06455 [bacterium]|nr:hypothetical protein [bacterium]
MSDVDFIGAHLVGSITPTRLADLMLLEDLTDVRPRRCWPAARCWPPWRCPTAGA